MYRINPGLELKKKHQMNAEENRINIDKKIKKGRSVQTSILGTKTKQQDMKIADIVEQFKNVQNKFSLPLVQNETNSLKTKDMIVFEPKQSPQNSDDGETLLLCSSKWVDGKEIKEIKIERSKGPLNIKSSEKPVKIKEMFMDPGKIFCGMKLIKIPNK